MQTTNIQEILSSNDLNHASSTFQSHQEFDCLDDDFRNRNSFEVVEIFEEPLNQSADEKSSESESAKDLNQGTNQILLIDYQEILKEDYLPESEEELINITASLNRSAQKSVLALYWTMGRCILNFYKKEYGSDKLRIISTATGIGLDNLHKACKFAREYSQQQVEKLLAGHFVISWNQITHNLTVEPEKLLEVYEKAENSNEFHDEVMKLKNPSEKRGKSRKSGNSDEQVNVPVHGEGVKVGNVESCKGHQDILFCEDGPGEKQLPDRTEEPCHYEADEAFNPETIDKLPHNNTPDTELLKAEIEKLKIQLDQANERVISSDEQFNLLNEELDRSEKEIRRLQKILKRIIGMVGDGDDGLEILRTYEFLKDLEEFEE